MSEPTWSVPSTVPYVNKGAGGRKAEDLTGRRFGKLVAISIFHRGKDGNKYRSVRWNVKCDCGSDVVRASANLISGAATHCGCDRASQRASTRVHKCTPEERAVYSVWKDMMRRCFDPSFAWFRRYGGRGVVPCEEWRTLQGFLKGMGVRPPGMTLERTDNDKGYSPENCRWATKREQQNNKETTRYLEWNGERLSVLDWAERLGVPRRFLYTRLKRGWSVEQIMMCPVGKHGIRRTRKVASYQNGPSTAQSTESPGGG